MIPAGHDAVRWERVRGGLAGGSDYRVGRDGSASIGPVRWIEGWQVRALGASSPILAILPFMPLPFAPGLARLLPSGIAHPFRLGIQQAFSPTAGPRFDPTAVMRAQRMATARRLATAVLVAGLIAIPVGVIWSWRASSAPVATPIAVRYETVAHAPATPAGTVLLVDAIERSAHWLQQTQVRGTTVRSEWRVIAPANGLPPWPIVEKIAIGIGDDGDLHRYARPSLIGRLHPLDDWTAARLREAGIATTSHPLMLDRSLGDDGDAIDAAMPGMLAAMLGLVAVFLGGILRWRMGWMT